MGQKNNTQETRSFSKSTPTSESPQAQQLLGQFSALFGTRGPEVDAFQGISPQAQETEEAGNRALERV